MAEIPKISEVSNPTLSEAIKERTELIELRDSGRFNRSFLNRIEQRLVFVTNHIADLVTKRVIKKRGKENGR